MKPLLIFVSLLAACSLVAVAQRSARTRVTKVSASEINSLRNSYIESRTLSANLATELVRSIRDYIVNLEKLRKSYDIPLYVRVKYDDHISAEAKKYLEEIEDEHERENIKARTRNAEKIADVESRLTSAKKELESAEREQQAIQSQPLPTDKELAQEIRRARREIPGCSKWTATVIRTRNYFTYKVTCYR